MTRQGLVFASSLALLILGNAPLQAEEEENGDVTEEQAEAAPSIYVELSPPFVTNVGQSKGRLSYVKAEVTLRVASKEAETAVKDHEPRLRHEMVMLLGQETPDKLSTTQGQDSLRQQALAAFNGVLEEEQTGADITDVLFTSFVVQR